eukprot:g2030.t1
MKTALNTKITEQPVFSLTNADFIIEDEINCRFPAWEGGKGVLADMSALLVWIWVVSVWNPTSISSSAREIPPEGLSRQSPKGKSYLTGELPGIDIRRLDKRPRGPRERLPREQGSSDKHAKAGRGSMLEEDQQPQKTDKPQQAQKKEEDDEFPTGRRGKKRGKGQGVGKQEKVGKRGKRGKRGKGKDGGGAPPAEN